jgi:hypothetical protein
MMLSVRNQAPLSSPAEGMCGPAGRRGTSRRCALLARQASQHVRQMIVQKIVHAGQVLPPACLSTPAGLPDRHTPRTNARPLTAVPSQYPTSTLSVPPQQFPASTRVVPLHYPLQSNSTLTVPSQQYPLSALTLPRFPRPLAPACTRCRVAVVRQHAFAADDADATRAERSAAAAAASKPASKPKSPAKTVRSLKVLAATCNMQRATCSI